MAKNAGPVAVDYGLKLSASLCFFSSLFCFLVALANQGDDKAKLKALIFASTVFFFFAASFFVCFLLKCFENDVAEQELFDVARLRSVDKSNLYNVEVELLLANLQLFLHNINEILNSGDSMESGKKQKARRKNNEISIEELRDANTAVAAVNNLIFLLKANKSGREERVKLCCSLVNSDDFKALSNGLEQQQSLTSTLTEPVQWQEKSCPS